MTHSGTSVALAVATLPRGSGAGYAGVDPAGTPGRCRARRRSHPDHHGSRWCRCVQSSARSGQPPVSIQTFGPRQTRCAGAGNGPHWRTAKATRSRRLSYADNRTATTSSTGATAFPSRERCSTTTSMPGSQALGDSTQQPAQPFAKRSPPEPLKRRCSLSSANVKRPTRSGPHDRIHPFKPPASRDRFRDIPRPGQGDLDADAALAPAVGGPPSPRSLTPPRRPLSNQEGRAARGCGAAETVREQSRHRRVSAMAPAAPLVM